ncbi:hypothetical protein JHK87_001185 [Glycine soja]|nr:hypothetical protein JHK87_001185 [Glycine soja]
MGGLCSKSMKGDKVFAKSDGHSDNHKSNGKNHKSTNMPSDLTSAGDHGLDMKKQEAAAAAGNGSDDFYDGLGCCHVRGSSITSLFLCYVGSLGCSINSMVKLAPLEELLLNGDSNTLEHKDLPHLATDDNVDGILPTLTNKLESECGSVIKTYASVITTLRKYEVTAQMNNTMLV